MEMLVQLWRPELELVGISKKNFNILFCIMKQADGRSKVSREEKKSVNGNAENHNIFQHDYATDMSRNEKQ